MFSEDILIPEDVITCPGCNGVMAAEVCEWETATGRPTAGGVLVFCTVEGDKNAEAIETNNRGLWEDHTPLTIEDNALAVDWVRRHYRKPKNER